MFYYAIKIIFTLLLIILISEISKRNTLAGGMLASIPLVSVLAMIWLYIDTHDSNKVMALSNSILFFIVPSLALFIAFAIFIKKGFGFYVSLSGSIAITFVFYYAMVLFAQKLNIKL